MVVDDNDGDSNGAQDEEARDEEAMAVNNNSRIVAKRGGLDEPWDSKADQNVEHVAANSVWNRHVSVTWNGEKSNSAYAHV